MKFPGQMSLPTLNPKSSSSSKLGNWKAEEFNKFAIVAPVVLAGIVPKQVYACFMLLVRIYRLVYSHYLRYCGWQTEHISYLSKLLWKHAIVHGVVWPLCMYRKPRIRTAPARRYQAPVAPQTITGAMCMNAW